MALLRYTGARTGLLLPCPPPVVPDPSVFDHDCEEDTIIEAREPQFPDPVLVSVADRHHPNRNARRARQRATIRGGPNSGLALRQYAEATLGGGSLRKAVKLPEGEDEDEWLAVNSVSIYNPLHLPIPS